MNADSIKKNWGMVVFLVVLLGVLGYTGWKLKGALRNQSAVNAELEDQERQLAELQRFRPYPSTDNVQLLRENRAELEKLFGELKAAAYRPVEVPQIDQVQFARLLGEKLAELANQAELANVKLPDQFVFGFEKYIGKLPPDNRYVLDTLTKQFLVIAKLSNLLFQSGAYGISSISRQAVDIPSADAAPTEEGRAIYQRTPFDITFTCNTEALQKFLNGLAEADWLLVVRSMNVEVKKVSFTVLSEAEPAPVVPAVGSRFPGGMPMVAVPPAGPRTTTVERQQIEVTMKIDLVEFPQDPKETAAELPS